MEGDRDGDIGPRDGNVRRHRASTMTGATRQPRPTKREQNAAHDTERHDTILLEGTTPRIQPESLLL